MARYAPGKEPDYIKRKLNNLFAKLDEWYPDKVVIGFSNDHKQTAETARDICKLLGYPDTPSFLKAYGYGYALKAAGRPKGTTPQEIVAELLKRYPNGSEFTKASDLFDANPDLGSFKTFSNQASAAFGMTVKEYLLSVGLLSKRTPQSPSVLEELQKRYPNGTEFTTTEELIEANQDLGAQLRTLAGLSNDLFGMTLKKYLLSIGLLSTKVEKLAEVPREEPTGMISDDTVDSLEYMENRFILTGFKKTKQYLYTDCIQRQGGIVSDAVTQDTYCLIFNHAAKQATEEYLAAVTMNKKGCKIIIISDIVLENIWAEARKAIELEREQYLRAQGYYDKLPNIFDDKILEGTKELDESKISDTVKLLHLPKSLKTFKKREFNCDNGLTEMRPCKVKYFVDEGNESLFTDEDSLYEVLPDGTYRLLAYQYFGRGKVLILENTSEIGEGAFWGHRELKTIDLPKDLKAIRKDAFAGTSLEIVALPKGLKVIEKGAFRNCTRLQKALPVSSLEVIERGVFAGCTKLDKTQAAWWRDNVRKG